jgi:hypothetical protein
MEVSEVVFKAIAILHCVAGYFFFGVAANEDYQTCFYHGKSPLAGDALKYLAYFSCFCMVACGIFAFLLPFVAVILAWLSFAFYLSTSVVNGFALRRLPRIGKISGASLAVRAIAASAMALTMPPSLHG